MGAKQSGGFDITPEVVGIYTTRSSGQGQINTAFDGGENQTGGLVRRNMAQTTSVEMQSLAGAVGDRQGEREGDTSAAQNSASSPLRRLSQGDRPLWLKEETEEYLLGRADAREGTSSGGTSVRVTEVAPSNSGIIEGPHNSTVEENGGWRMSLVEFSSKKQGVNIKNHSKRIRSYYKAQDEMIDTYETLLHDDSETAQRNSDDLQNMIRTASIVARVTFAINFALMVAKAVASALSGSIAIISSLVDSVVDLLSGIIMWWASRAIKKRNFYVYPQGRTKLEPVAIIILSVVMAVASLQLVRESVVKIVDLASAGSSLPVVEIATFVIAGATIVIKLIMWLVYRRIASPTVAALSQDAFNDVLSNSVAIVCGYLGSKNFKELTGLSGFVYVDPAGAIAISLYIIINWWKTGKEQIKLLTGHTASPQFLSKLTWIALNHHSAIQHIDTVRAFHFGNNFLVEVDIILPENMPLKEAHNIGEELQHRLESLAEVERAFVHLDYEFEHNPNDEHKIV